MSSLRQELVFLVLQFLEEEKFECVHRLEQESGFFFNMKYFEEKVRAGEWDEVEKYLSGFTKVDDNPYSRKTFFEIRKQKYLEALDRQDKAKAVDILVNDMKVFSAFSQDSYRELTQLLTLPDFRQNEQLSKYGDTNTARSIMLIELKRLIQVNPLFREKLVFPTMNASRLRTLINQSLNWQHQLCNNPNPYPDIKTLLTDHTCSPPIGALAPAAAVTASSPNHVSVLKHPIAATATVAATVVTASSLNHVSVLKRPTAALGAEQSVKRPRPAQTVAETTSRQQPSSRSLDDLPRNVALTLQQGASVTSMDFHPYHKTLLLVGSDNGEVTLWGAGMQKKLVSKEAPFSVSRVRWSPDGDFFGAAFSKNLVRLYAYAGPNDTRQHLEIDAHSGGVNDLAFVRPNKHLWVVTCGDDKLIKVWDYLTGRKLYSFEGHESPVYSILPHQKENINFILSTAVDGKVKVWLYDDNRKGPVVDYDAPVRGCTRMLYSADGSRLFSCGTGKEGDSFLVEWNETEGAIKRNYSGLFGKKSNGVVQFDTTQNHFLAAGQDNQIIFWDMDNNNVLATTDADGGLPPLPRLRFNKDGSLLAVTTSDNGIKLLANAAGFEAIKVSGPPIHNGVNLDEMELRQLAEIVDPVHCRMVTMPDNTDASNKVARLLYTNSGNGLLALGSSGVQKLWKWEQNPTGEAIVPQLWQPKSGLVMANDVSGVDLAEAIPCIALSKNGSYVMSAAGGKVSLFNVMTFKMMATFMQSPPASTFLAFHPQDNNIIAVGMEDSTVRIYNVRMDEVKAKLESHQKRITGLAFSTVLNVLVSSGADAQLCVWSMDAWEKRKTVQVQLPATGDTRVQFHSDQIRLLVSHEAQLAVYDVSRMDRVCQWVPQDGLSEPISCAAYSCDSQLVYASFCDGNLGVFDAETLRLRCRIAPSAYLSQASQGVYPLAIAAHPRDPNQFAVGLNDGSVKVMEPQESDGKWGVSLPADNGASNHDPKTTHCPFSL